MSRIGSQCNSCGLLDTPECDTGPDNLVRLDAIPCSKWRERELEQVMTDAVNEVDAKREKEAERCQK